jgi:uncharacterized BrkB/YihY/UPF0761 family membrane protein
VAYRLLILALLAATLAYLALARRIPLDAWSAEELINSRTLPTVYGALLAATLVVLLLGRAPAVRVPQHVGRAAALFALSGGFVWLVPILGVWIALGMMLIGAFLVMGERRPETVVSLGVGIPAFGWLAVEHLLGIYVPGPWA